MQSGRPIADVFRLAGAALAARRLSHDHLNGQRRALREQLARLRSIVEHAQQHVPLYRELYGGGAAPRLCSLHDLRQLPIIDRDTVAARDLGELRAGQPPEGSRAVHSSGTTGRPQTVWYPPEGAWFQAILTLAMTRAWGVPLRRTTAWISPSADTRHRPGPVGIARRRFLRLPASRPPREVAERLLAARPAVVSAPGRLLADLGRALDGGLEPVVVVTLGELLSPEISDDVESVWGLAPLDTYGTTEHGLIAWQCPARDLYHVNHSAVIVEVLDERGEPAAPGVAGDLVLTGLWNRYMPFLRYRLGDSGAIADRACRCGSTAPALERVDGRVLDHLVDSRGRRVAPQLLWLSLHLPAPLFTEVRRYRVHQDATGRTRVELVVDSPLPDEAVAQARSSYRRLLGEGRAVEVVRVPRLDPEPSGKFRIVSSVLARGA